MTYQYLTLPTNICQLEAGRKDIDYRYQYGYDHYGHDYGHPNRNKFNIVASGEGKVLLATKERGSLGCIAIVKYPNVYLPKTNVVTTIIVRYYHMESLSAMTGQSVVRGTVLGRVGDTTVGLKHVHVEVDTDAVNYLYSPQVSKSCLYLKQGYKDTRDTTFNPNDIFYIGDGQEFIPHPINTFYGSSDVITRALPKMDKCQKLILPVNNCKVNVSQYSKAYKLRYNMEHYGVDFIDPNYTKYLYGCGNGEVLLVGWDKVFGNTLIVLYKNVYNHRTDKIQDIVLRYFHMANIRVATKQKITIDILLGSYGNTGLYSDGNHLHVPADYDTTWYNYEAGLKASSNLIKKGNNDTMFNPIEVFHIKKAAPECQRISGNTSTYGGHPYVFGKDIDIPKI